MEYTGLAKYKAFKERELEKKKEKVAKAKALAREKKKKENYEKRLKRRREEYKPIHLKNLRRKQNRRAYLKRRAVELEIHRKKGDSQGFYRIVLTKNYTQYKELSYSWWMLTAYKKFNKYIEDNHRDVICEKTIAQSDTQDSDPVKYEILLLKKIDPEFDDGVRELRNEEGMFIENKISNNEKYAIIAKSDWFIPETYNVYGYNPVSDRKTGKWIFDNLINNNCCRENMKNVFMCDNKLIIYKDLDFDFVICKNKNECLRLYNALESNTGKKNKFVIFSSYLVDSRKSWLYNELEKKTGWDRDTLYKKKG
jgi:hypothetical protein